MAGNVHGYRFAQVPFELLDARVTPATLCTFAVLSRHASSERRAFPSRRRLAEETGLSVSSVDRSLKELREGGWITVEVHYDSDGAQAANTYWLYPSSPVTTPLLTGDDPPSSPVTTQEELEPEVSRTRELETLAPTARARDLVFESVAEVCGIDWHHLTPSARGQLAKASSELRLVDADPDDIEWRAAEFRRRYPEATLTPTALSKHWPALSHEDDGFRTNLLEILEERRSERVRGSKDSGPDAIDVPSWEGDAEGDGPDVDEWAGAPRRYGGLEGAGGRVQDL